MPWFKTIVWNKKADKKIFRILWKWWDAFLTQGKGKTFPNETRNQIPWNEFNNLSATIVKALFVFHSQLFPISNFPLLQLLVSTLSTDGTSDMMRELGQETTKSVSVLHSTIKAQSNLYRGAGIQENFFSMISGPPCPNSLGIMDPKSKSSMQYENGVHPCCLMVIRQSLQLWRIYE